jgi:hypothetical protein
MEKVAVAPLSDGRLQLWTNDDGGSLFSTWKTALDPNALWTILSDFLAEVGPIGAGVRDVAVAPLSDGRLELWASDGNGGLWTTWKVDTDPNANWSGWSDFLAEVQATESTFTGTAVILIDDSRFPGPFTSALTMTAFFTGDGAIRITAFPPIIVGPFSTPIGPNTITVTMTGGGVGTADLVTGTVRLPINLLFNHSLPDPPVGDSTVAFALTTGSSASPSGRFRPVGTALNRATGAIVLVSGSRFRGGFLGGTDCSIVVAGTLTPSP